jgi:transcriptional regulator with XRE-family HTH domain
MLYRLEIEKQRTQFINVIDYLKSTGITQKDIGIRIGLSSYDISHLCSGETKNIPTEVIENLQAEYNINPQYITHGAANMFDTASIKYENFQKFVNAWDLVEHEDKEYLHFTMDENFYNFLVDVYYKKEASLNSDDSKKMEEAFNAALKSHKENFSDSSKLKEYVLIPLDNMLEIATDNVRKRKNLTEVLDILSLYPPKE